MENQKNSRTESAEQTAPEASNEQQATLENNQNNADVSTHKQLETKVPDVTGTETITDTSKQPKQFNPAQDVAATDNDAPVVENANIYPLPKRKIRLRRKSPLLQMKAKVNHQRKDPKKYQNRKNKKRLSAPHVYPKDQILKNSQRS